MLHVTLDDIAEKVGVSRATVSMAMRGSAKVSAKRRDEILLAAQTMGYRPNIAASQLARSGSSAIGVLLADLHNPLMSRILDGFAPAGEAEGPDMHLASGFNDATREGKSLDRLLAHRVAGVILFGSRLPAEQIRSLAANVPTVAVGRAIPGVDSVRVNDALGGSLAAEHLIKSGHRHIAHIDGGNGAGSLRRKQAFVKRCAQAGDVEVKVVRGDYSQQSGFEGASRLFGASEKPTAVFAANDIMALGVLGAARQHGLSPGRDLAVCGFDDIEIASSPYVSLTSISYDHHELGRVARDLMTLRMASPVGPTRLIEISPTLVVRDTSSVLKPPNFD